MGNLSSLFARKKYQKKYFVFRVVKNIAGLKIKRFNNMNKNKVQ